MDVGLLEPDVRRTQLVAYVLHPLLQPESDQIPGMVKYAELTTSRNPQTQSGE